MGARFYKITYFKKSTPAAKNKSKATSHMNSPGKYRRYLGTLEYQINVKDGRNVQDVLERSVKLTTCLL